jgi:hypothetical protein
MALLTRVVATLALILVAFPASAQMTTGSISGRVTDSQGGAMPGVSVEARHRDTGFSRTDITDQQGMYHLGALPVGSYDFSADLTGFRRYESPAVAVNIGRAATIDFVMQLGPRRARRRSGRW